jgi:hypothetical protein
VQLLCVSVVLLSIHQRGASEQRKGTEVINQQEVTGAAWPPSHLASCVPSSSAQAPRPRVHMPACVSIAYCVDNDCEWVSIVSDMLA